MVTCNHMHLLVLDDGGCDVIPESIQLIAGRTAQDYNNRKGRKGAFWEDRYHATAVESDIHLAQCMTYIDMNMVRAGVVTDPEDWKWCGYHEIQRPRERYGVIDHTRLMELLRFDALDQLRRDHRKWIEESLIRDTHVRESTWTESIAVGSKAFVEKTKERLGSRARGRGVSGLKDAYHLRESGIPYSADFGAENSVSSSDNTCFWDISRYVPTD